MAEPGPALPAACPLGCVPPLQGWQENKRTGLALGLAKGVVGLHVRPVVGVIECSSKVLHSLALATLGREGILGKMQVRGGGRRGGGERGWWRAWAGAGRAWACGGSEAAPAGIVAAGHILGSGRAGEGTVPPRRNG